MSNIAFPHQKKKKRFNKKVIAVAMVMVISFPSLKAREALLGYNEAGTCLLYQK